MKKRLQNAFADKPMESFEVDGYGGVGQSLGLSRQLDSQTGQRAGQLARGLAPAGRYFST